MNVSDDLGSWPRIVHEPRARDVNRDWTVFSGIFGTRWVDNAISSVDRQSIGPLKVIVAVNGSNDEIESKLLEWQRNSQHEVWVVVNAVNLGPMGSFVRNRDLISSEWTAFFHQDDIYLQTHLTAMSRLARESSPGTVALFTSIEGVSEDGKRRMTAPPFRNEVLRLAPPQLLVPAIVRRHPFPTPAFAVRAGPEVHGLAWYDSGAPDSEWLARLGCLGTFEATDEVTVLYRQPASSESSRTGRGARAWQWAVSLDRLLNSAEFMGMLLRMEPSDRSDFAAALLAALPARYPDSPAFYFLQFVAAQMMCEAWSYGEPTSLQCLADGLGELGQSAALVSLTSLGAEPADGRSGPAISALVNSTDHAGMWDERGKRLYRRFGHRLPTSWRRQLLSAYYRLGRGAS
jgi:hypothetical protein